MADPWAKLKSESPKAFGAFHDFLQLGPGRKLTTCAEEHGHRYPSLRTWSVRHNWTERAGAYDVQELAAAAAKHEQTRARIRQKLMDRGEEMAEVAMSVAAGRVTDPCICEDRAGEDGKVGPCRCGAWAPIRDREGNYIGDKPMIAASTRYIAAAGVLDRNGITVPKRVELTGADGEAIRLEAAAALGGLSKAALDALAAAFGDGDGDS